MSTFINEATEVAEDGAVSVSYSLTSVGYIAIAVIAVIAMLLIAFIVDKKQGGIKIGAKQLAFAGISLAVAYVTSYIGYELPYGGKVTLFSMFFICFVGYVFGIKVGILTAFSYSLLQFLQSGGKYFLTPFQTCCDYFFAFTALGLAGIWFKKKHGLVIGYVVACLARGLFHTIGGYLYWMSYMPENFPASLSAIYPIVYNYSYILIEMVITLIIIAIPPVKDAINRIAESYR
ncbi:MAG: energy-coupled thiamine transporter ThiT [Lachnospiraceae bacterium]|nr:energy-coupled thiamine transporter ThiT [Lachnospiraceae bacterium]